MDLEGTTRTSPSKSSLKTPEERRTIHVLRLNEFNMPIFKATCSLNSKAKTLVIKVVFLTHIFMDKHSLIMLFDEDFNSTF